MFRRHPDYKLLSKDLRFTIEKLENIMDYHKYESDTSTFDLEEYNTKAKTNIINQRCAILTKEISKTSDNIEKCLDKIDTTISNTQDNYEELRSQYDDLENQAYHFETQIEDLTTERNCIQEKADSLSELLENHEREIQKLKESYKELSAMILSNHCHCSHNKKTA
jgi:chromosome segregation ATPase